MYTMSRVEAGTAATAATAVRRERLNRDRVLQAAVALADESGIGAVSMRGLAKELGVVPMALYKHVADKDELLDGMVDVVIGEFESADSDQDWKGRIRQRILAARRAVLRHPWARPAIESRTNRTQAVLGYMDSIAGEFRAGGFSADLTHHVMHALGNRIWGFSPELFEEPPRADPRTADSRRADPRAAEPQAADPGAAEPQAADPRAAEPQAADPRAAETLDQPPPDPQALEAMAREYATRFPNILAIALAATDGDLTRVGAGCDEQFEFEFALDLLLDGAERLHRQGWRSNRASR